MRLGYHSITWGGVVGEPTGVTSIKNLHYRSNGSIVEAVRDIAAAGYEGIEIFDGNLADYAARPDDLRRLLADSGLELVSVYCGANFIYADMLPDELYRVAPAADLAATVGAQHLVVGGGAAPPVGTRGGGPQPLSASPDPV